MSKQPMPPAIDKFMLSLGFKTGEYKMSQVGCALFFWYMFDIARVIILCAAIYLFFKFIHVI